MQAKRLSENLLVSSQLLVTDVATAVALGIRSIINNRPDGEAPDQPSSAEIEAAAKAAGLGYRHIPVPPGLVLTSTSTPLVQPSPSWIRRFSPSAAPVVVR
jgi:sulfide:quinone oxidoreductase